MTTPDSPGDGRPPVPLGYETPPSHRPPAGRPSPRSPLPPPVVVPGPLFGLTIAGLFILLAMAVVAIVEVVGR